MLPYVPLKFKLERVEKIAANLKALGASPEEIEKATETIYQRVIHDHLERIAGTLKSVNPGKDEALFNDLKTHDDWHQKAFEKFIADSGLKRMRKPSKWLLDLDYFRSTHKLRREDHWQS
jgi:hypothetical protein